MSHSLIFLVFLFGFSILQSQDKVLERSIKTGEVIYKKKCATCHGKNGLGKGKRIPPLAKSDYLRDNLEESIRGILFGQQGEIMVNGVLYNKRMRAIKLTNLEVADVMNFVQNSWGNSSDETITPESVAQIRRNH